MGSARSIAVLWPWLLGATLAGCAPDPRADAKAFLTTLNAIDISASTEERGPQLARLRALEVKHPEVQDALRRCLAAHDALIMAEEEQQRAQHALDAALAGSQGKKFSSQEAMRLNVMINRSSEGVARARTLFPACNQKARSLTLRYGK